MLAPRAVGLNQYGNLPKSKLASLRAKPNVYIGPIKTKSGRSETQRLAVARARRSAASKAATAFRWT